MRATAAAIQKSAWKQTAPLRRRYAAARSLQRTRLLLGRPDVEDADHARVGVVDDVAVEQPQPRMGEGELQRVGGAREEGEHLCGPARALQRPDRYMSDAVRVKGMDLVADVDHTWTRITSPIFAENTGTV